MERTIPLALKAWNCRICGKIVSPYYKARKHSKKRKTKDKFRIRQGKGCCKSHSTKIACMEGRIKPPNPKHSTGACNTNWKGGIKQVGGYKMILAKNHPHSVRGYVMEHRIIIETIIGRYLDPKERVHHINGIKNDNRPENLQLVAKNPHQGEINCPFCHRTFLIR